MGRRESPIRLPDDESVGIPIGTKIRALRRFHKVGIQTLADNVDYTASHISQVESGNKNPSPSLLERISQVLNIEPIDLIQSNRETVQTWIIESKKLSLGTPDPSPDLLPSSIGLLTTEKLEAIIRKVVREEVKRGLLEFSGSS